MIQWKPKHGFSIHTAIQNAFIDRPHHIMAGCVSVLKHIHYHRGYLCSPCAFVILVPDKRSAFPGTSVVVFKMGIPYDSGIIPMILSYIDTPICKPELPTGVTAAQRDTKHICLRTGNVISGGQVNRTAFPFQIGICSSIFFSKVLQAVFRRIVDPSCHILQFYLNQRIISYLFQILLDIRRAISVDITAIRRVIIVQ